MHSTQAPQPAAKLPICIPTTYTDAAGHYCLAYPRSPFNPLRYMVARCGNREQPNGSDLECVHDDMGNLVPVRERFLHDDWAKCMWRPVAAATLAAVSLALAACGGGGDDELCRPDFVGPPAPEFAHLPVCQPGDGKRVPPNFCAAFPERCS